MIGGMVIVICVLLQMGVAAISVMNIKALDHSFLRFIYRLISLIGAITCLLSLHQAAGVMPGKGEEGTYFLVYCPDIIFLVFMVLAFCQSLCAHDIDPAQLVLSIVMLVWALMAYGLSSLVTFFVLMIGVWITASAGKMTKNLLPAWVCAMIGLMMAAPRHIGLYALWVPAQLLPQHVLEWQSHSFFPFSGGMLLVMGVMTMILGMGALLSAAKGFFSAYTPYALLISAQGAAYLILRTFPESISDVPGERAWGWVLIFLGLGFAAYASYVLPTIGCKFSSKGRQYIVCSLLIMMHAALFMGLGYLYALEGKSAAFILAQSAFLYSVFGFSFLTCLPSVETLYERIFQHPSRRFFLTGQVGRLYGVIALAIVQAAIFLSVMWLMVHLFSVEANYGPVARFLSVVGLCIWGGICSYIISWQVMHFALSEKSKNAKKLQPLTEHVDQNPLHSLPVQYQWKAYIPRSFINFLASCKEVRKWEKWFYYIGISVGTVALFTAFFWQWVALQLNHHALGKEGRTLNTFNWQNDYVASGRESLPVIGLILLVSVSAAVIIYKIYSRYLISKDVSPFILWNDGREAFYDHSLQAGHHHGAYSLTFLHLRRGERLHSFFEMNSRFIQNQFRVWKIYFTSWGNILPVHKEMALLVILVLLFMAGLF